MDKQKRMWFLKAAGGLVVGFLLAHFLCGCSSVGSAIARDPAPFTGDTPLEHGQLRGNLDAGGNRILGGSDFGITVPPLLVPQIGPVLSVETAVTTSCDEGSVIQWDVLRTDPYGGWQAGTGELLEQYSYVVPEALDGATLTSSMSLALWQEPEGTPEPAEGIVTLKVNGSSVATVTRALPESGAKVLATSVVSVTVTSGDRLQWVAGANTDPFECGGAGGGFWRLTAVTLGE